METRFNPDGTLALIRWARPQFDGPATRALMLMHYARRHGSSDALSALLDADIDFTLPYSGADSYDIWEERCCTDYYTQSMQQRVLAQAADPARARGEEARSDRLSAASGRLGALLDAHWPEKHGCYLSAVAVGPPSERDIDISVVLEALHSGRTAGRHSFLDPRMQATLARLIAIFADDYPINRKRPDAAPTMGRFRGDAYESGGAWYLCSLGAAEFHYRLAGAAAQQQLETSPVSETFLLQVDISCAAVSAERVSEALIARGDGFMQTLRRFTPDFGALSEQFDQRTGQQSFARHLGWSFAAFFTAASARRQALRA